MSNSRVLVAQLGARRHYQQPTLFHQWGILDSLYTDFYAGSSSMNNLLRHPKVHQFLPNAMKKGLERYEPSLNSANIIHLPWLGYQYTQAMRQAKTEDKSRIFIWAAKKFCQQIIKKNLKDVNVVYGFNGASLELFEYAKKHGIRCILDQTLAELSLVHRLLLEEEKLWPDWSLSPFTVNDADLERLEREQREQELADCIICGSSFVKDSLIANGVNAHKIFVVSLGRCKNNLSFHRSKSYKSSQTRKDSLRILFAGTVELRKGVPYLLEALKLLKGKIPFTCKIAGSIKIKKQYTAEYKEVCEFLGRIPRSQMAELYAWANVFILPSICEGSAMVNYEALNWNLPIITTPNSGAIIRDQIDGFIVPIRSSESLCDSLIKVFNRGSLSCVNNTSLDEFLSSIYDENKLKLYNLVTQ